MPLPFPERPPIPEHPGASRFPKNLRDLIGWTADRVKKEIGAPDSEYPGDYWFAKTEGDALGKTYMRHADGEIRPTHRFGPRAPEGIELGQKYTVWRYANIGHRTVCLVYLVKQPGGMTVFDVNAYSADAIF
ncbi:MAG: hypothetical protein HS117_09685 [Verrucomicrobiaceae bacterium]|nr:hypothetical protein [Verrucomicrobiaceae bacterium]